MSQKRWQPCGRVNGYPVLERWPDGYRLVISVEEGRIRWRIERDGVTAKRSGPKGYECFAVAQHNAMLAFKAWRAQQAEHEALEEPATPLELP